MKKIKATEKALITSLLSLAFCFTMLFGATYAWFTANNDVSTAGIEIGSIGVDIVDKEGTALTEPLSFYTDKECKTVAGKWEPGSTFYLPEFYVKNDGDITMKYTVSITVPEGLPEDVITWQANGEAITSLQATVDAGEQSETAIQLSGTMDESVLEEAFDEAGKTFGGLKITVIATQIGATTN